MGLVSFTFVQLMGSMSVRLKQQLHQGILRMLPIVQTQAVQVNGLGEFYFCPVDG